MLISHFALFHSLFPPFSPYVEIAHFAATIILPAALRSFSKTLRFCAHDEETTLDLVRRFKGAGWNIILPLGVVLSQWMCTSKPPLRSWRHLPFGWQCQDRWRGTQNGTVTSFSSCINCICVCYACISEDVSQCSCIKAQPFLQQCAI